MRNPRVAAILSLITDGRGRRGTLPGRLCAECLSALPVSGVGVTLVTAEGPYGIVLAATDRRSRQLEELQFTLGEGPCVDAARTGHPLLHPDLPTAGPTRWPKFCKAALPVGIRAVFAFPLSAGTLRLGVLTMHRDTPGRLTRVELAEALAFAEAATAVLLHLRERSDLVRAGAARMPAEVDHAIGMITVQLGVSLAEALLRLRAHAYATGRTVADVAADVVGHRLRFGGNTAPDRPGQHSDTR